MCVLAEGLWAAAFRVGLIVLLSSFPSYRSGEGRLAVIG